MRERYRKAEMYMYHYPANMKKLRIYEERLAVERTRGDVRVQVYSREVRNEGICNAVEDWLVKCENLGRKIIHLLELTAGIRILENMLRVSSRYRRRYELMLGILENVYYKREKLKDYVIREGYSLRTAYRARNELVMMAAEYCGL